MSRPAERSIFLPTAEATIAFGRALAARLTAGDTLLLSGPIGAGKSLLARAIIQARQAKYGTAEDVPSPTFTLVQTYEAGPLEIWHADLYRLGGPDEIVELGLEEAFGTALCLVEWPDRLGNLAPPGAIHVDLATEGPGRRLTMTAPEARLDRLLGLEHAAQDD